MPETPEAIRGLADTMITRFTPPSFVPGCEVKSIADIDEYTTNNGWIEAIVGGDNQQRVRYYGTPQGVAVNDFVDVEYFPAYKLYRVFGSTLGGTASVGGVRVSEIWESDFGNVAAQADATGQIEIGKLTGPDAKLEVLDTGGAQFRLSFEDGVKFSDFTLDTNHDLLIKPSSIGQIKLQPTTDSIDFFQVLDADGGAPVFNVDTTGERVSIGTTDTSFIGQGSVTQNTGLFIENPDAANYHGFTLRKISDSRFTVNSMLRARAGSAAVQDDDFLGGIQFWGHDGTDYNRSSAINAVIDGSVSANTMPGALLFYTTPTNSPTERMRIAPDGDVGIGTNAPLAQLHIDQPGSAIAQPVLYLDQADVDEPFTKFVGTAAAANLTRSIVDDGDVTTATLVGWTKIEIDDIGNQVTDGVYYRPFYSLA